jgi:hypothetical protein
MSATFLSGTNVAANTHRRAHPVRDLDPGVGSLDRRDRHRHRHRRHLQDGADQGRHGRHVWLGIDTGYSDITGNSDEVTGTGYTAGGTALTNVDPYLGCHRLYQLLAGSVVDIGIVLDHRLHDLQHDAERSERQPRCLSVHDFAGTQTVASGTFTAVMPVAALATAILQIT